MSEDTALSTETTDAPAPEPSRRDEIAAAFDKAEAAEPAPAPAPAGSPDEPPAAPAPAPGERVRGPDGRFQPATPEAATKPLQKPGDALGKPGEATAGKPPLTPPAKPQDAPKAQPDALAPPPAQLRAPASWKPAAREQWAKTPPEVQQEIVRRESETARVMKESAGARDALGHVQRVIGPYAQNIQASGTDALGAIDNFFKADNTLRHGSLTEKAQTVASIIRSYGVDIATLDAVLAGQPPQSDPNAHMTEQLRREMQQQLRPVLGLFNQIQGQRQQAMEQINSNASTEVEAFSQDQANEFFEDVRQDMADIIDLFTARGVQISLRDAYDRAIKLNPQVSAIIAQRADQERANAAAAAAQRARRTAASIGGSPAPAGAGPGPASDDRRAAISAAWDAQEGG